MLKPNCLEKDLEKDFGASFYLVNSKNNTFFAEKNFRYFG